ncbi:hypothetical protein Tco_0185674 [Tanacetum coccineum]
MYGLKCRITGCVWPRLGKTKLTGPDINPRNNGIRCPDLYTKDASSSGYDKKGYAIENEKPMDVSMVGRQRPFSWVLAKVRKVANMLELPQE